MPVTALPLSLTDYLAYDDGTETRYELENGVLIAMPPESNLNQKIVAVLLAYFLRLGLPPTDLRTKAEIAVSGARATVRLPDLLVLSAEGAAALDAAGRGTIMPEMPPPRLVVEVVAPGQTNHDRDYRYKRSQYEARGIAEYWIVDPQLQQVTVLTLVNGLYKTAIFQGDATMQSPFLAEFAPNPALTAAQVLQAQA